MNTFDLSLDLDKKAGVTQWVTMRQGDHDGTQLRATIYDHGTQVSGSYTCRVSIRKPTDNEYYRETCSFSGGVAIVTVDEQYAASEVGITYGYFELLQGTAVIASTESFGVRILQSAIDGAIVAPPYDSAIEDALAELDEATGRISQMVQDATAEYLEAHPELTTTVEDNSLTDAKLIQKGGILQREQWLETMLPNIPRKATAEADVHSVTDSAGGGPLGIEVYGRSTQDGTPTPDAPVPIQSVTPNLLGDDFGTWVKGKYIQTDGVIANNGTYMYNEGYVPVQAGLTYTLLFTKVATIATVYGSAACYDSSKAIKSRLSNIFVAQAATTGLVWCTFTVPAGTSFVRVSIANNATGVAMYEGRVTPVYVPNGNIGLHAVGRNLLVRQCATLTTSGITFTVNEDGSVHASGTATDNAILYYFPNDTTVTRLPAGNYRLSGCPAGDSGSKWKLDIRTHPTASNIGTYTTDYGSGATLALSAQANLNQCRLVVYNGTTIDATFRPQLEVGSVAHDYQPYAPVTLAIDLGGRSLRSLPDGTRDEVTVDEWGHAVLTQRVGVLEILASDWGSSSAGRYRHYVDEADIGLGTGHYTDMYCTAYQPTANTSSAAPANTIRFAADGLSLWLAAGSTLVDSEVNYILAEPRTIDLGYLDPALLPAPDLTAYVVPSAPSVLRYGFDVAAAIAEIATS